MSKEFNWEAIDKFNRLFNQKRVEPKPLKKRVVLVYVKKFQNGVAITKTLRTE